LIYYVIKNIGLIILSMHQSKPKNKFLENSSYFYRLKLNKKHQNIQNNTILIQMVKRNI